MSKKAFDKIAEGLNEALSIARTKVPNRLDANAVFEEFDSARRRGFRIAERGKMFAEGHTFLGGRATLINGCTIRSWDLGGVARLLRRDCFDWREV